jgi:LmbE family N-acetylglucosaminyl deacetylase
VHVRPDPLSAVRPPPGTTTTIEARSALVLAPHFDDEVLGCGGLVAQLTADAASVRVVFCSDGGGDSTDPAERRALGIRRREEARGVATVLGLAGIDELGLPDGALAQHVAAMAAGIRRLVLQHRPRLVFVPSPLEVSADHRAVFAALHRALEMLRTADDFASDSRINGLLVLVYEVNHPLHPDILVDVGATVPLIERAMACYASQQEQHHYLRVKLGLLKFRTLTLPPSVEGAEAYRRLYFEDFITRSPARLVADLGGVPDLAAMHDGPLISLIVRTRNRPHLLAQALESVARSTYRRLEVLVVNDGGRTPSLPAEFPLPLTLTNLSARCGRAGAANAGIGQARGEYVAFLDDDDLVEPEHFATLIGLVCGGARVAYTDAATGIYEPDAESGWRCAERRLSYSRDFDPELLLFDNYIPFNTVLVERALLTEVGPLDVDLPIFEDWDLLIRLSERAAFHHLPRVTCEYRHFRGGAHQVLGERPADRPDFMAVKARVIGKHGGRAGADLTARVIVGLRGETVTAQDRATALARESDELRQHADRLARRRDVLGQRNNALRQERDLFRREVTAMQGTRVWRLAERLRALRRSIFG